ncbi:MAG: AsmA family protein [Roseiarcus sp.]|uniref:AsmA family protein n=1 Tax=Roseiarcus sp. TaxID=1969460 RepID=UPI003C3FA073
MRIVLTIVAVALVAILSTALVAPLLVDWSAHRSEIESRLAAMTGADIALTGPIGLRLLPTPYLEVGAGSVSGKGEGAPRLSFESARLELALVKLASGAIRFSEIELEKPILTMSRGVDGAPRLPALPLARADTAGFDRLVVKDGRVRVVAGADGVAREIDDIQLNADAASIAGPFHVSGQFSGPGPAPVVFRLASEKSGPTGTPVRASVDAGPSWPALDFDGALANPGPGRKGPGLSGSATLIGAVPGAEGPMAWRAAGRMTVDLDRATIDNAQFRFGPEERALTADGAAILTYASPARLAIEVKAKQANLDALLRRKGEDGVAPARAVALLSGALAPILARTSLVSVEAKLVAETIILGADTVSDVSASVRFTPGAPLHARFDLGLPGHSRLSGEGDLETSAAPKFDGMVDFGSEDFALFRQWASPGGSRLATNLAALGDALADRSASLSGHVEASATDFSGRDVKITLDRSTLEGSLAFTSPNGADPGRLTMDLSSDLLDVDSLPNVDAGKALVGDLDLSLSLRARTLHVARVNETELDSGSLALKVVKTGPNITLDRLSIADLGGANFDAQGAIGQDGAAVTGRLRADGLRDLALLVARLAPGEWSRALVERAVLLSPTALAFEAHGGPADALALRSLKASGSIGQTQATLNLDPGAKGDRETLTVGLDSPDSVALIRQLGLSGASVATGRGHISLEASGVWNAGYDLDGTATLAGVDLAGRGRFLPAAEADEARLFGSIKLNGANVAPLLATLGVAPAGGVIGPVDASADMTLRGDRWTASRLAATVAGVKASGNLAYQPLATAEVTDVVNPAVARGEQALDAAAAIAPAPPPAEITGDLALDRLPIGDLFGLVLGAPQAAKGGARWSGAKFAATPFNPPPLAVRLHVGALDLGDGLPPQDFSTMLSLEKGRLDLDDIAMKVAQGAASGRLTLRRDKETATLTGALSAVGLAVARPGFSGRVGATLEFASTGGSAEALIEGLAGNGTAQFAGAALARSDPAALDRVVAKAQAPDAQLDETNIAYAFGVELNKAPLPIPDGATPLALTSGTLKFGPLSIARPRGKAALDGSFDLRRLALETRLALVSTSADLTFWSGPPPGATVAVDDALDTQKRRLDVSALSAGLATQAISRESERIAALEADIRERAFFNRRLKGERFMDRRAAEIEDWRVEQARLKGLTERLAAEREAAAEKAAAEKAAAEKAAAEKAAAEKAAADKAAVEKSASQPDLPSDLSPDNGSNPAAGSNNSSIRADQLGVNAPPLDAPIPPARPKPRPAPSDPTASGLY